MACSPYASDPDPAVAAPAPAASAEGPATPSSPEAPAGDPSGTTATLEVVLSSRPIQAFAIGDTHVFTLESDVQTRLVAIAKAPPHALEVILEEDILDGVRFESVGAARGRVFVVDTYGAMRSAKPDGSDVQQESVAGAPTWIGSAGQTLWLADLPRFLGDSLVFRWFGANASGPSSGESEILPTGDVGDVTVDDEALVYATGGSDKRLWHWAPAASGARKGHRPLATLPEEGRGVGVDASRAYVYLPGAKEIRGYDRSTGASTTILAAASFDTAPRLRSDGKNLYMLTETALRRCSLTSCASTMKVIASGLTAARALVVDATHAWMVMLPKDKTGAIARVPK